MPSANPMELPLILYSILILSLTILLITIISFITKFQSPSSSVDPSKYPPGKTGWPIIGESLEFLNSGRKGSPEKFITDRMNKFSSEIFRTSLLGEYFAVLCGPAGNKFLFSNEGKLVESWWPRSVDKMFPSYENISNREASKRMRKLLPQFFKPEALQRYIPIMDTIARKHLHAYWANKKEVVVFPLSKDYTFALACKVFLSVDDTARVNELGIPFAHMASGVISIPINLPGTAFNRGIKASNFVRKELVSIIKQRKIDLSEKKASSTQDILSHMLLTEDDSGKLMSEMEIANKILGLLIAGHDTASAAITFIMKYLAELPHIYDEVLKEQMEVAKGKGDEELLNWEDIQKMKYSWNVACEVLRLAPPIQGAFREAIDDFDYAGFSVPKGWKLYWSANSTHKNPEYFEEPDKFDPSRFEGRGPAAYTFIPFGGGPRMCPGKEYAKIEILVFMYHVVRRYKWEKIDDNERIVFDPLPMPANGLPIRLFPQSTVNDQ